MVENDNEFDLWVKVDASNRKLEEIKPLVEKVKSNGGNINYKGSSSGYTILHKAALNPIDDGVIEYLLAQGADPTLLTEHCKKTALNLFVDSHPGLFDNIPQKIIYVTLEELNTKKPEDTLRALIFAAYKRRIVAESQNFAACCAQGNIYTGDNEIDLMNFLFRKRIMG